MGIVGIKKCVWGRDARRERWRGEAEYFIENPCMHKAAQEWEERGRVSRRRSCIQNATGCWRGTSANHPTEAAVRIKRCLGNTRSMASVGSAWRPTRPSAATHCHRKAPVQHHTQPKGNSQGIPQTVWESSPSDSRQDRAPWPPLPLSPSLHGTRKHMRAWRRRRLAAWN